MPPQATGHAFVRVKHNLYFSTFVPTKDAAQSLAQAEEEKPLPELLVLA